MSTDTPCISCEIRYPVLTQQRNGHVIHTLFSSLAVTKWQWRFCPKLYSLFLLFTSGIISLYDLLMTRLTHLILSLSCSVIVLLPIYSIVSLLFPQVRD